MDLVALKDDDDVGVSGKRDYVNEESESIRDKLVALYSQGDAQSALDLLNKDLFDPLLLWVAPQRCCLDAVAAHVRQHGLSSMASVGCGSGLLEWLLVQITGIAVEGYEVNEEWWKSRYAPPVFLEHKYVDLTLEPPAIHPSAALMCCYFNGGDVFRKYVEAYRGPLLIIIGSAGGPRHTDPRPLDYALIDVPDTQQWLQEAREQEKEDGVEGALGYKKSDGYENPHSQGSVVLASGNGRLRSGVPGEGGTTKMAHGDVYNYRDLGRGPWRLTHVHRMTEFDLIAFYVRR